MLAVLMYHIPWSGKKALGKTEGFMEFFPRFCTSPLYRRGYFYVISLRAFPATNKCYIRRIFMKFWEGVKKFFSKNYKYLLAGLVIGGVSIALGFMGNPKNMAFCIACFLRDTAGALGLHGNDKVQYARPEIIGIVLGAFVVSLIRKDFKVTGGSAPLTRFVLGVCVMIGALIFLGCPLRMVLRIAGGDLNAVIGLFGFIGGIVVGVLFLNKGFTLKRTYELPKLEGYIAPVSSAVLLILILLPMVIPAAAILFSSTAGPGSMHAPIWASLLGGAIVGVIGQILRICFISGVRDSIMFKQFHMLYTFVMIIVTVMIVNAATGNLKFSFSGQPVAHQEFIWNILGLFVVGLGSVFLGGCPFRQLVLAGSGNSDSSIAVLGMIAGGALAHTLKLASAADVAATETTAAVAGGATVNGMIACVICIVILLAIGFFNIKREKKPAKLESQEAN